MTHTYITTIDQPTLHYLTRSVRRRAATSKRRNRPSEVLERNIKGRPFWSRVLSVRLNPSRKDTLYD